VSQDGRGLDGMGPEARRWEPSLGRIGGPGFRLVSMFLITSSMLPLAYKASTLPGSCHTN